MSAAREMTRSDASPARSQTAAIQSISQVQTGLMIPSYKRQWRPRCKTNVPKGVRVQDKVLG